MNFIPDKSLQNRGSIPAEMLNLRQSNERPVRISLRDNFKVPRTPSLLPFIVGHPLDTWNSLIAQKLYPGIRPWFYIVNL